MYGLYEMLTADGGFLMGKPFAMCEEVLNCATIEQAQKLINENYMAKVKLVQNKEDQYLNNRFLQICFED